MAKVIEQVITIKFSKMVKNSEGSETVISDEVLATLIEALPQVCDEVIADAAVISEVEF